MARRIPEDAFDYYVSLGASRSHQAVADRYGVSKRAVTKLATKERWRERVHALKREARRAADERALETLEAMNTRHLKALKIVQGKALEALKSTSLSSAMEAVRALDLSIKQERTIRGEPSDRTAVSVEEVIRSEYAKCMTTGDDDEGEDAEEEVA